MKKVLVFGGTRFFGKKLVDLLLGNGDSVTIATRGITKDDFGDRVSRIIVDRTSVKSMNEHFSDLQTWDVIYDNICYSSNEAKIAVDLFRGKVKKYVFTSTMSVYSFGKEKLVESDFDSSIYPIKMLSRPDADYGEGKRMAESFFIQKAPFPIVAPRFPIILGMDDYTKRLHFYIERVSKMLDIGFHTLDAKISFITSTEAANFMFWVGNNDVVGPINACSNGEIILEELISWIERETGIKAMVVVNQENESSSPFLIPENWYMSNDRARSSGFDFKDLKEWLPKLVHNIFHIM